MNRDGGAWCPCLSLLCKVGREASMFGVRSGGFCILFDANKIYEISNQFNKVHAELQVPIVQQPPVDYRQMDLYYITR